MDSSFLFDAINLGWSIVYIEWSQVIIKNSKHCISFSDDHFHLSSISSGSSLFANYAFRSSRKQKFKWVWGGGLYYIILYSIIKKQISDLN